MTETNADAKTATRDRQPEWAPGDLCDWRYRGKSRWNHSHVLGVMCDRDGSVRVLDKRTGFDAYVPDVPECIRRRTA